FLPQLFTNSVLLWPWLGGMLELSGVLGGRSSLARSRAISARSAAASAISPSIAFACAKATPISPSRSSESNPARSIPSLNQKPIPASKSHPNLTLRQPKKGAEQLHEVCHCKLLILNGGGRSPVKPVSRSNSLLTG